MQLKTVLSLRDIPLADADCQGQLNWCSCAVIYVKEKPASLKQEYFSYTNTRANSHYCPSVHPGVQQPSKTFSHNVMMEFSSQALHVVRLQIKYHKGISKRRAVYNKGQNNKNKSKIQIFQSAYPTYVLLFTLGKHKYPQESNPKFWILIFFSSASESRITILSWKQKHLIYIQDVLLAQSLLPCRVLA